MKIIGLKVLFALDFWHFRIRINALFDLEIKKEGYFNEISRITIDKR